MSSEYYDKNADTFIGDTFNLNMEDVYKPFLALLPSGARILDAGSGSGRDTLSFIRKGYVVVAFDASEELVERASKLIGQRVLKLNFEDVDFHAEFDGIWACASLLHVPRKDIDRIIDKLAVALKLGGILYVSFKHGDGEEERDGRLFNNYAEDQFRSLISQHPRLQIISVWLTSDVRKGREHDKWLNALLRRESDATGISSLNRD